MQNLIYNRISDDIYIGVVTILDYETSLRKCLSELSFSGFEKRENKVIIDLALKSGINEYRFITYNITESGNILWETSAYITPSNKIIEFANSLLRAKHEIVSNSMLPSTKKNELLRN